MSGTAVAGASADRASGSSQFGAGRAFLADSRLVLAILNEARYQTLNRVFGASREQANLFTVVLALGAANGAHAAGQRARAAFPSGADAAMGGFVMREAGLAMAGPGARAVPWVGTLVGLAMLGGLAGPGVRRVVHEIRAAEHNLRDKRVSSYRGRQS
jgi:hypothetical protein